MKKLITIVLMCSILLFIPLPIYAIQADEVETIKIGYFSNYGVINEPFIRGKEGNGFSYCG